MNNQLRILARHFLPLSVRRGIVRYTRWPPVGIVRFGQLRRLKPVSPDWGAERGRPIDRHYIERFLAAQASLVRGRVLEIGDASYTRRYGGDKVTKSDVLHVREDRPGVTIKGDLTDAGHIPSGIFDCIILTQTLQVIYDIRAALQTVHRILAPGGTVLVTVPGISKISRYDMDRWGYYWSFTSRSMQQLFEELFPAEQVRVETHGNVLAAIAFLHGLATEELSPEELAFHDPDYELLITVTATRPRED